MPDLDGGWFKQEGVYGEDERASHQPKMRPASAMEQRRLSQQPEYTYFLPYLPLVVCPSVPDVASEYCQAYGRSIEIVTWTIDRPLVPSLSSRNIDTRHIFGVRGEDGPLLMNFARGIVLQDEGSQVIFRLRMQQHRVIEPGVSLARPAEKILADQLDLFVICVQSPTSMWTLQPKQPSTEFLVHRHDQQGDPSLWKMMKRFWRRDSRSVILER